MKTHLKKNDKETYCGRVLAPHWGLKTTDNNDQVSCRVCRAFICDKEWDYVFGGIYNNKTIKQIAKS